MTFFYKIVRREYTDDRHVSLMQFTKFCLVGLTNAVVYYIAYAGSLLVFRKYLFWGKLDYQISQIIGFAVSVFWAFNINRKHVFCLSRDSYIAALVRFYLTYAFTGLFVNAVLLCLWKSLGISEFIAPFINVLFTTPINYLMAKWWAFKKKSNYSDPLE